jgi:hypothetical protein
LEASPQATWDTSGEILVQLGVRAIPVGIAALFLTFVLESAGTQAGPADTGSTASGISVFGAIHPDIFRLPVPLGAGRPLGRLQLASLEPQVGFDAPAKFEKLAETSASTCWNASLDDRLTAFDARPASFWTEDCPASFDERFRSAMSTIPTGLPSPPERGVANQRTDAPKPIVSRSPLFTGQPRKEVSLPGDDGRIAIYDITAHTVYLPGGRRLEAHSGLGNLMDNPRHAHLRMRGPTPPNLYNLTLRERIFHGVRAIRLNPADDSRMHGRDGILAHSYMLGGNGQSNGCVAFRNYPEFLDAFRKGEVTRLAVVDRLDNPPGKLAAGQLPQPVRELIKSTERNRQYAAAGDH